MNARPWTAGYRQAEPCLATLTALAAGSGARAAWPYWTVRRVARLAPLPATPQERV
jgi:hypothetical protein